MTQTPPRPDDRIIAPRTAAEGGKVEIRHPQKTTRLHLRDAVTGRTWTVPTGGTGSTGVRLPAWLRGGSVVIVVDPDNPPLGTLFEVLGTD